MTSNFLRRAARGLYLVLLASIAASGSLLAADFRRGDVGGDGTVDADDSILLLEYLFTFPAPEIACLDAADANDDGTISEADAVLILNWSFGLSAPPPRPGPFDCGIDPTPDPLGCDSYSCAFIRGDANGDGIVSNEDVGTINAALFLGDTLECLDAADVNDDGEISPADAVSLAAFLSSSGPPPALPGPLVRGVDYTKDTLDCAHYIGPELFRRGDADRNGFVNTADGEAILAFLFQGETLDCLDAADANDDGEINVQDVTFIESFLLAIGPAPAAPGAFVCGVDETADGLTCESYSCVFLRGDVNANGYLDVGDVNTIELFLSGAAALKCEDTADADDNGQINLADTVLILSSIGICDVVPAPPGVLAGIDPTGDQLFCQEYRVVVPADFSRGDCNVDGLFDIADPISLLSVLFPFVAIDPVPLGGGGGGGASIPGVNVPCRDACDANDDGCLDIGDAISMLSALFPPAVALPPPYMTCGYDPTPVDGSDCRSFEGGACP